MSSPTSRHRHKRHRRLFSGISCNSGGCNAPIAPILEDPNCLKLTGDDCRVGKFFVPDHFLCHEGFSFCRDDYLRHKIPNEPDLYYGYWTLRGYTGNVTLTHLAFIVNPYNSRDVACEYITSSFTATNCEMPEYCGDTINVTMAYGWFRNTAYCSGVLATKPSHLPRASKVNNIVEVFSTDWTYYHSSQGNDLLVMYDGDNYWFMPKVLMTVAVRYQDGQFVSPVLGQLARSACYMRFTEEQMTGELRPILIGPTLYTKFILGGKWYSASLVAQKSPMAMPFWGLAFGPELPQNRDIKFWRNDKNSAYGVPPFPELLATVDDVSQVCYVPRLNQPSLVVSIITGVSMKILSALIRLLSVLTFGFTDKVFDWFIVNVGTKFLFSFFISFLATKEWKYALVVAASMHALSAAVR